MRAVQIVGRRAVMVEAQAQAFVGTKPGYFGNICQVLTGDGKDENRPGIVTRVAYLLGKNIRAPQLGAFLGEAP